MTKIAVRVEGIAKRYKVGARRQVYPTLRDKLASWAKFPTLRAQTAASTFWALKDVSFELKKGDVIGIIGHNGAGKSTLLKILSRITEPTAGYAELQGRTGSLLEVGTGFHPELTGRENVFLNGAILGMRKTEIARNFDEIVAFAGVEKFVDTAVKHYSSGMYLRLAFAVAAHLETEILLVDEVLAVGDLEFQQKCLGKMQSVSQSGRTVLFVSHNLAAVKEICQTCLLLEHGSVSLHGAASDCIVRYSQSLANKKEPGQAGNYWQAITITGRTGKNNDAIESGEPFSVSAGFTLVEELLAAKLIFVIDDPFGNNLVHSTLDESEIGRKSFAACQHSVQLTFPGLWLASGIYSAYFKLIGENRHGNKARLISEQVSLDVHNSVKGTSGAILTPKVEWEARS